MKIIFLHIILIMFSLKINAGAPAPSTSLPEPPYVFEKGTLISAEVDWNKDSIQKFVPNDIKLDEVVNGSVEVFLTKHEKIAEIASCPIDKCVGHLILPSEYFFEIVSSTYLK